MSDPEHDDTNPERVEELVDAALETELAHRLIDFVGRQWVSLEPDEDIWASATIRVRVYLEWATAWALSTVERWDAELDLRPENFVLLAATRFVSWGGVPDPDRWLWDRR